MEEHVTAAAAAREAETIKRDAAAAAELEAAVAREALLQSTLRAEVGRCRLKPVGTHVETAWFQRLNLHCDELFPSFALNFQLRCYMEVAAEAAARVALAARVGTDRVDATAALEKRAGAVERACVELYEDKAEAAVQNKATVGQCRFTPG